MAGNALGLGRRWSAVLACLAVGGSAALAQNWANFVNETSTRLNVASNLAATDPEEKDYAWGDVDKDGDEDVIVVRKQPFTTSGGKRNLLLMNEGIADGQALNGVLVDRAATLCPGFLDITNDRDVILVDVNGDTWLDMVTAVTLNGSFPKSISHPRVYINRGLDGNGDWLGFAFDDVNRMPTWTTEPRLCGVGAGDIDNDGDADLFFADYGGLEDRLLVNDGNGYFTDVTAQRMPGLNGSSFGTSAAILDVNGDRNADIVRNMSGRTDITYNNPNNIGFFQNQQSPFGGANYFMAVGDLNNDGRVDVAIADDGTDRYWLNQSTAADGTVNWLEKTFSGDDGFGGTIHHVDINNDGFDDIFVADVDVDIPGCNRRAHFYRNLGNVPNVTLTEQGQLGIGSSSLVGTFDAAFPDLNGDGWRDIVLGRCTGTQVYIQTPPAGVAFSYPTGLPGFVAPNQPTNFNVKGLGIGGVKLVPNTGKLFYSIGGGAFTQVNMTPISNNEYIATLPAVACAEQIKWYVSIDSQANGVFKDPSDAPTSSYASVSALGTTIDRDEIEGDVSGWLISADAGLTAGGWEQAIPNGTVVAGIGIAAPDQDATNGDENVRAFVTENGPLGGAASANDVDGGTAYLVSPVIDLAGSDGEISYARWFFCDDAGTSQGDTLRTFVSNDNGASWVLVDSTTSTGSAWETVSFLVSDFVTPTATVRVRFATADSPNNSVTEAGIDNFQVTAVVCDAGCAGDIDGDGKTCQSDLNLVLAAFDTCQGDAGYNAAANLDDSDNCIGQGDLNVLLASFECGGCN